MAISLRVDDSSGEATIVITDSLTFQDHHAFTAAYKSLNGGYSRYVVDMCRLQYLDSSALGMLLRFREHLADKKDRITIMTSLNAVPEILRVARFDTLFALKVA